MDDAYRLRARQDDAADAQSREETHPGEGSLAVVVKTKQVTTYPTAAGVFYACSTQAVTGTETEGTAGTLSDQGDTLYCLNLGSAVPPLGTALEASFVNWRWVFRWDG